MRKIVTLLLTILLATTTTFSSNICQKTDQDSIVSITPKQLKETNLIFVEHSKLLTENSLLIEQLNNYKSDNIALTRADSIKSIQIENYKRLSQAYNIQIDQLNSTVKKKNKAILGWKIGGVTVGIGLVLLILAK